MKKRKLITTIVAFVLSLAMTVTTFGATGTSTSTSYSTGSPASIFGNVGISQTQASSCISEDGTIYGSSKTINSDTNLKVNLSLKYSKAKGKTVAYITVYDPNGLPKTINVTNSLTTKFAALNCEWTINGSVKVMLSSGKTANIELTGSGKLYGVKPTMCAVYTISNGNSTLTTESYTVSKNGHGTTKLTSLYSGKATLSKAYLTTESGVKTSSIGGTGKIIINALIDGETNF